MKEVFNILVFVSAASDDIPPTRTYEPLPRHLVGTYLLGQKKMLPSMLYVRRRRFEDDDFFIPLILCVCVCMLIVLVKKMEGGGCPQNLFLKSEESREFNGLETKFDSWKVYICVYM